MWSPLITVALYSIVQNGFLMFRSFCGLKLVAPIFFSAPVEP